MCPNWPLGAFTEGEDELGSTDLCLGPASAVEELLHDQAVLALLEPFIWVCFPNPALHPIDVS